jgi:hypothetical protein
MADTAPSVHNWLAGDDMNADRMNEIADQISFLRNPPMIHVTRTLTTQALTQGWNFINFDTVVNGYDPYDMFDSGAPDRITCQIAGWYTVEGQMSLNQTSTEGRQILGVYKNGTATGNVQLRSDVQNFPGAGAVAWTKEFSVFLNVGDWLHLGHWFFTDTTRTTIAGSTTDRSRLRARWISN